MISDEILVAYANISAGLGFEISKFYPLHEMFERQGMLTEHDLMQLTCLGVPVKLEAYKMGHASDPRHVKRMTFTAYLEILIRLTSPGAVYHKLL